MSLPKLSLALPLLLVALFGAAPASATRHHLDPAAPRAPVPETFPDLSAYRIVTVEDLDASSLPGGEAQKKVATELADAIALALALRPELGLEVRRGAPLGRSDELVLGGTLLKARKGSRAGRYFVGPLAAARLVADLAVRDASTGEQLAHGRLEKSWGMPGIAGVARGMGSVVKRASDRVADWFEDARGQAAPLVMAAALE